MSEGTCSACQYFLQHYCLGTRKIFRVYCGHCTFSGAKQKRPDAKACDNFVPGHTDTDAFVTKEYLSKELLRYVLSLQILPEIEEIPISSKKDRRKG